MKPGRKPTPTETLKLLGTFRKDRHADRADGAPPEGEPVKPDGFGPVESALWDQVVPILIRKKLVGVLDTAQLISMCRHYRHYIACDLLLEENPADKNLRVSALAWWTAFDRVASKFGLTSADLAALKVPRDKPANEGLPARKRAQ